MRALAQPHVPTSQTRAKGRIAPLVTIGIVTWAALGASTARAGDDELTFHIKRYDVHGNSALSDQDIHDALAPVRGLGRTFEDVFKSAELLQAAYVKAGFAAVQVALPEQDMVDGVVRLDVIEPRIVELRAEEANTGETLEWSAAQIQQLLPALKINRTPDIPAIDDAVRLANTNPSRRLAVALEPTGENNGVRANVKVQSAQAVHVAVSLDNSGNAATGRTRLSVTLQHAQLTQHDDVLTMQTSVSPERVSQVQSLAATYQLPRYAQRGTWDVVVALSNAQPSTLQTSLGPLQFAGRSRIFDLRWTGQLPTQSNREQQWHVGLGHRSYFNTCSLGSFGQAGCPSANADIELHPLSLGYRTQAMRENWSYGFSSTLSHNLPSGKMGSEAALQNARALSKAAYTILRTQASATVQPPQPALKALKGWQWHVELGAQLSADALTSPEQFGIGGARSVRGYAEQASSGDRGWLLRLEATGPGWGQFIGRDAKALQMTVFRDAAQAKRNQALAGESQAQRLASWGLGVRLAPGPGWQVQLDAAQARVSHQDTQKDDWRLHAAVSKTW